MGTPNLQERMEDHALEQVPPHMRQGWLKLSWNTAGIVTTLIILFFGALTSFVAGFKIALTAGLFVAVVGWLIGWACGHIAYKTGLSSTVMARRYGFGIKGSIIGSLIFGFMIIGFLALENALLYAGFRFALGLEDIFRNQLLIYGALTLAWVLLTAYGFELVSKISSYTLVAFMCLLVYMTFTVVSAHADQNVFSFGALLPPEALAAMGASDDMGKFIFATNVLIGSAGALALVDADLGRYAKSSGDIGAAAAVGNIAMSIVMVFIGAVFMYAGMGKLVEHYTNVGHMSPAVAQQAAMSPDGVTAAFLLFGGALGVILMVLAQGKAQVLNTYSGSLALSNLFDAMGLRARRVTMVVLANVIGLLLIAFGILGQVQAWIEILGVITTAFATIMIVDYFFVNRSHASETIEQINWSGVITCFVATVLAHYVLNRVIPIQFFTSVVVSAVLYPVLRTRVLRPAH
ncbi:cytosine permease [Limnohabitans sp.]|uniref:purine-cytosine permease family protein n=1 Tax=Limnohabitans sp. TaxID=1907725 RepID=UPI00286F7A09|nr:cytosine permease [Limnohabitans sp.]